MATQKIPLKNTAGKTNAVKQVQSTSHRPSKSEPNFYAHFATFEEELAYVYGSMTPEDDVEILYKAGILTPSGRLSSKFK
ncbi:hypothetical protein [Stenotrophomonas sp. 278]|uniref:hypothetical protein n=1 Tax=Stenotrophomonas sp. 278 TaxID=2479851 RepID=UPI000F67EA00|nr:hypothetical protein [Stenotrophomonas sp. 278]RRU19756.1 hypothetical protein EGJ34_05375 [Stenotrophomonas sp. 278]